MPTTQPPQSHPVQRAVLWDLDGTIIDTSQAHWNAWREVLASEGIHLTREVFISSFGQRNDTILKKWIRPDLNDREVERIGNAKERLYRQILPEQPPALLPGVEHWMHWLREAGWRQALATMTPLENLEVIFSAVKTSRGGSLRDFLNEIVTGNEVSQGKPDPAIFLLAAKRLGVDAERCVVIEDASAGIEAARRARMRCIAVNAQPMPSADRCVRSLEELSPGVLEEWAAGEHPNQP